MSFNELINGRIWGLYLKVEIIAKSEIAPTNENKYFTHLELYNNINRFPTIDGKIIDNQIITPEIKVNIKNIIIVHHSDINSISHINTDIDKTGAMYHNIRNIGNKNHLKTFIILFF